MTWADTLSVAASSLPMIVTALLWSTLAFAAAWLVTSCLKTSSSAVRSAVWSAALAVLLVLPPLAMLTPSLEMTVLPSLPSDPAQELAAAEVGKTDAAVAGSNSVGATATPAEGSQLGKRRDAEMEGASAGLRTGSPDETSSADSDGRTVLGTVLMSVWLAGAAVVLGRFGLHLARIARTTRAALARGDTFARADAVEFCERLSIARPVSVLLSDEVSSPLSWGVLRPVVILPSDARGWSSARRRSVLMHELAHVARADYVWHVAAELARAAYWMNPMIWVAISRYGRERERACDDVALLLGTRSEDYAEHLLEVARARVLDKPSVAVACMVQGPGLRERIRCVMDTGLSRAPLTLRRQLIMATLAVAVALPLSSIELSRAEESSLVIDDAAGGETAITWLAAGSTPVVSNAAGNTGWTWSDVPTTDELISGLGSSRSATRRVAAWWLGERRAAEAVPALLRALNDPSNAVRLVSAWALGAIGDTGDPLVAPALISSLDDEDYVVREMVVLALGRMGQRGSVGPIMMRVMDRPELAAAAAWALEEIGGSEAERRRDQLFEIMRRPPASNHEVWVGELPWTPETAHWVTSADRPSDDDMRLVLERLRTGGDNERRDAAFSVGALGGRNKLGTLEPLEPLLDALRDPVPEVRAMAAWALGEINPSHAARRL